MPTTSVILIFAAPAAMALILVAAMRSWVYSTFMAIAAEFPQAEPLPGAVRKRFQSIRVGLFDFGFSFHISADEQMVHFVPAGFVRMFGARSFSVPWDAVKMEGKHRGKWMQKARIGRWTILGPAWALKLAEGGG